MFKAQNIFFLLLIISFLGCDKDGLETKPSIKISAYNPKDDVIQLSNNTQVIFAYSIELEFADKEGDIDDTLWIQKIIKNKGSVVDPNSSRPILIGLKKKVPEFSGNKRGNILYNFTPDDIKGADALSRDTICFRFMLKDKKNNKSDTITSKIIEVIKR
jgi:hypothetical protein